jgi:dolichol kinase
LNDGVLRRFIHLLTPIFLIYYWIPDPLFGVAKDILLLGFLAFTLCFDWLRSRYSIHIKGLRWYESQGMAAYAWFGVGFAACVLFFDKDFVIPSVIVLGFVDPLCGITKRKYDRFYPALPLIAAFAIFTITSLQRSPSERWVRRLAWLLSTQA